LRFEVYVLGVLLLSKFGHTKCFLVAVDVVEHVSVLVTSEPLVFPVKA